MKKTLLALTILLSVACAKNNDNNSNPPSGNDQPTTPAAVGDLLGTWNKPCASAGSQGGFVKNTITVEPTTATMQSLIYQNSSTCAGTADLETRANLNYTVPNYTVGQVNQIDMTVNTILAKFNTQGGVALANTSLFCGFNDWAIGVEKDVTGRNCVAQLPGKGAPYYDIFKIQGGNQLFTGKVDANHDGLTPQTRPAELDTTPYTR